MDAKKGDGEWTKVTSKSKRRARPHPSAHSRPHKARRIGDLPPGLLSELASPAELMAQFVVHREAFKKSDAYDALRGLLDAHGHDFPPVTSAVCLGIGSFDSPGKFESTRRAFVQLAAFEMLVGELSKGRAEPIRCYFQEPLFTASDITFLTSVSQNFTVVESPRAYRHVSPSTLFFGVHLYHAVYIAAVAEALPAVYVGTSWETWRMNADITVPDDQLPEKLKELDEPETFGSWKFPENRIDLCFSDTSVYWRKPAADPTPPPASSADE